MTFLQSWRNRLLPSVENYVQIFIFWNSAVFLIYKGLPVVLQETCLHCGIPLADLLVKIPGVQEPLFLFPCCLGPRWTVLSR